MYGARKARRGWYLVGRRRFLDIVMGALTPQHMSLFIAVVENFLADALLGSSCPGSCRWEEGSYTLVIRHPPAPPYSLN